MIVSPHLGGAEKVCLDLAEEQIKQNHTVRVGFLQAGNSSLYADKHKIEYTISKISNLENRPRFRRWKLAEEYLKTAVREFEPDLVHSHVPFSHLLCHRVLPKLGIPWVGTSHGSWRQFAYAPNTIWKPYLRPYLKIRHAIGDAITLKSASAVVAVSESVRRDLALVGISPSKVIVIHNGVSAVPSMFSQAEARQKLGLPMDVMIFGAMGYFAPVKGFDILVRAFAPVASHHPGTILLIAGGDVMGSQKPRQVIEKLVARLGIQNRVRLLPAQDPQAGFMSALDVFVVSSRTEGMPLVLLEAMWHRKPSIVTSAGGCSEAARPTLEGLRFRSEDDRDLADKMEVLLNDPALRESLAVGAWARASSYLTLSRCANEYETVYSNVLAGRRTVKD